jgi:hypothetical protein
MLGWYKYNAKEKKHIHHLVLSDCLGLPAAVLLYALLTWPFARFHAAVPGPLFLRGALVLASLAAFLLTVVVPAPTESMNAFKSERVLGRWVYLTRQGIALQFVHQLLSLFDHFRGLTHTVACFIAAFGWFVTIQWYVLVRPNADYRAECKVWHERGVPMLSIEYASHLIPMPVAVVDMLACKDRVVQVHPAFFLAALSPLTSWIGNLFCSVLGSASKVCERWIEQSLIRSIYCYTVDLWILFVFQIHLMEICSST